MRRWLRRCNPVLAAALATVGVVLLRFLLGGVSITVGQKTLTVGAFDGGGATGILSVVWGAFVAHHYTTTTKGGRGDDDAGGRRRGDDADDKPPAGERTPGGGT